MPELPVPLGWLWIRSPQWRTNGLTVYCLLGDGEVNVVDGYAKYSLIDRKRRRAIVEWDGGNPPAIEIPFMINRWDDVGDGISGEGVDVEQDIRSLEKMAGLDEDTPEPPPVIWDANAPHDHHEKSETRWVVEELEWDKSLRNSHGNRVRQSGTLTVRAWEADKFINTGAQKARSKTPSRVKTETYRVHKGDTLKSIAKKKLGKASRWREIQNLNKDKTRDPDHLKAKLKLRIPVK